MDSRKILGKGGRRIEQREKFNCDTVSTKASVDSRGISEARMAFQRCPKLKQWGRTFIQTH